jgi:hypothetical protein
MDEDKAKATFSEQELDAALQSSIGATQGSVALGNILEGALRSSLTDELLSQILTAALLPRAAGAVDPEVKRTLQREAQGAISAEQLLRMQQASRHWSDETE